MGEIPSKRCGDTGGGQAVRRDRDGRAAGRPRRQDGRGAAGDGPGGDRDPGLGSRIHHGAAGLRAGGRRGGGAPPAPPNPQTPRVLGRAHNARRVRWRMAASSTSSGRTPSPRSPRLPTSRYTSPCVLQRPSDPCAPGPAWLSQRRLRWQAESYKFARLYPLRQAVRPLPTAPSPAMPAAVQNLPW